MQGKVAIIKGGASSVGRRSGEPSAWHDGTFTVADLDAAPARPLAENGRAAGGQAVAGDAARILLDPGAA